MDRYSFLRALLPATGGNYVAVMADGEIKWNVHCASIEELADTCQRGSSRGWTAYFALGTFNNNLGDPRRDGSPKTYRKAEMAHEFQTFAIDIDAGKTDATKCYATSEDALRALIRFLKESQLPPPTVFSSGSGFHVYWPLTVPIPKEDWRQAGHTLKALCRHHGLIIDESKIHDPSMVLRPLDTTNKGKPVQVLGGSGAAYPPLDLIPKFGTPKAAAKPAKSPKLSPAQNINAAMMVGMEDEYPPALSEELEQNCAQIGRIAVNHGATASYDLWFHTLGVAKCCENPEATAIRWRDGYPSFDQGETLQKMASYSTGMPTCAKLNDLVPKVCNKCPHWEKINSPYRLGLPDPVALPTRPEIPVAQGITETPVLAPAIEAPNPFRRTAKGVVWNNNGSWDEVCHYDIFPTQIVRDPTIGHAAVEWVWNKPHVGYVRMLVRMAHIFNDTSPVDLNTTLADNGVLLQSKMRQLLMGQYMRLYVQKLQQHQASIDLYDSFGWKHNYTRFVLGSTELRLDKDGTVSSHEVGVSKMITGKQFDTAFAAKGDFEAWKKWTKLLDFEGLEPHQVELGRAFASPLMPFTGLSGAVLSLYGETGAGTSSVQGFAASVYGDLKIINTSANDTQMAIVQRMGVWNNLPLAIDEITNLKPEVLANFMYWSTQGQDRNRANEVTQANRWSMLVSMSSNRSTRDKIAAFGTDVEAIQKRVLELHLNKSPIFEEGSVYGRKLNLFLLENYGWAGREYITFLLKKGPAQIRADIEAQMTELNTEYGYTFKGDERYWEGMATLVALGLRYASELGLIQFDYRKGVREMLSQCLNNRRAVNNAKLDAYDLISDYLSAFNGASVTVTYRNGAPVTNLERPRGEVRIRKELYATGTGDVKPSRGFAYLDKAHFRNWLVGKGFDLKVVLDTVTKDRCLVKPSSGNGRVYMGRDAGVTLGSVTVIALNLNHDRFRGMLGEIIEEAAAIEANVVGIRQGEPT